jgi:electron transfer flavoprotein alpha subunit
VSSDRLKIVFENRRAAMVLIRLRQSHLNQTGIVHELRESSHLLAADLLVSVGRGIGSQDNLEEVQELADALGAPLSASRPVTDSGWLPKTRQVGKSGLKVKPKVYLTFGISGAPEHLEGMRDAELIIACNTDEAAPIFDVAHYGTTIDLFDLVPAINDKL